MEEASKRYHDQTQHGGWQTQEHVHRRGVHGPERLGDDPTIPINVAGINPDDRWVTVEGTITQLFDEPA